MDSVTQIALGAAVGEAFLGRKVGNKAILWGGIAGLIPDLDMIAYPLLDEVERLSWHRGLSHSILFSVAFAPVLGWLIYKLKGRAANWKEWSILSFLALFTHIVLDMFTIYGTQIFRPFSSYKVAFNSIAIVDPLYTVPLIAGVLAALFIRRSLKKRKFVNLAGLTLSTAYLLLALVFKFQVGGVVERSLAHQGIEYSRYMTGPTVLNSLLWRITVEDETGYWVGYYSLLDSSDNIELRHIPRNDSVLEPLSNDRAVRQLLWFSDGYYVMTIAGSMVLFHDLRFGELDVAGSDYGNYIFTWRLKIPETDGDVTIVRTSMSVENAGELMTGLWNRVKGI